MDPALPAEGVVAVPDAPVPDGSAGPAGAHARFERQRGEGYLRVLQIGAFTAATVMLLDAFVFWRSGDGAYLVFSLLAALALAAALYGVFALHAGHLDRAIAVPLVYLLLVAPVGPALVASRALVSIALPIITMAVAMTYAHPRYLRAYGVVSWLSGTIVMAFWQWHMVRDLALEPSFGAASVAGGSLVLGFSFYVLSHYSGRLRTATAEAETSAGQLEAAHAELREVDAARVRFMNNAAHELKTPITPISIQLHLLRRSEAGRDPKARRALEILDRNFERLQRLIGDILDGARLDAGKLRFRLVPFALSDALREAIEEYERAAELSGIRLEHDIERDLHVEADPIRIRQVVDNFLSNALKFTPPGGTVTLDAFQAEGEVLVSVRDTGMGIAPQDLDRLFQAFTQVHDPMETVTGGSGLGLYIARGIVEQHHGRIYAQSDGLGRGATFTFVLPDLSSALAARTDGPAPVEAQPGRTLQEGPAAAGPADRVTPSDGPRA